MEDHLKNHIKANLAELVRQTTCHTLLIAFLESRNILSESNISQLNSIGNRLKKSLTFYRLIIQRSNSFNALCEALKETNQSGALEILERIKPIRFDVRQPVHLFTGRDEELAKLHEHMTTPQNKNVATLVTHTASVTGLGGIGKTELCRKYIQKYSSTYNGNVIWIGAEKPETMENSFKVLAKDYLNISLRDADGGAKEIKTIVDQVYNYFQEKKCLFVFDNAVKSSSEDEKQLETFLPVRISKRPFLLITSRDREWELPMSILELEELKEHEAIEFVKKGLSIHDHDQDEIITDLVTKLQRFPLALQQAISFIKQQQMSNKLFDIGKYLKIFEAESKLLLTHKISPFLSNKYANTTFTTWKITTDVIATDKDSGYLSISLLNMMSYFEPDKIPTQLLLRHERQRDEDHIHAALQLLVKYSMISCQPSESMLNIHRLVQQVTKLELKNCSLEEETLRKCLLLFNPDIIDKTSSVSHAISVFDSSHDYQSLVVDFSQIPCDIMIHLDKTSRYNESLKFGKKSISILRQHLPPDHMDLACTQAALSIGDLRLKNHDNVVNHLDGLQEILEKQNTSDNDNLQKVLTASVQYCKLKLEEEDQNVRLSSTQLLQKKQEMLETMEKLNACQLLDDDSLDKGFVLQTLAHQFFDQRKFNECLLCYQALLEYKSQMLGENDLAEVPRLIMNVAELHVWTGDVTKSLEVGKQAFEKVKNLLQTNILSADIGYRFAKLLGDHDGHVNEAILIANEVYECRKNLLGPQRVDTLASLLQIGKFKSKAGLHGEAVEILGDVCNSFSLQFGERHAFTLDAKTKLANALYDQESYLEALKVYDDVLKVYLELRGPSNRNTLLIMIEIGTTLMSSQDYSNSLKMFTQVANTITETCGNDDTRLVQIRKSMECLETWIAKASSRPVSRKHSCCCIT